MDHMVVMLDIKLYNDPLSVSRSPGLNPWKGDFGS